MRQKAVTKGITEWKEARRRFMDSMSMAMTLAVDETADLLLKEMHELTSATDHSLRELGQMGHPYRRGAPQGHPHDDFIVHFQSGRLAKGIVRRPTRGKRIITAEIHSRSKYTWYLLLGTRYMRPRDFVSAALLIKTKEIAKIMERAHERLHEAYDSGVAFRPFRILLPHVQYPAQLPPEDD